MTEIVLLLAMVLNAPAPLVRDVYAEGGLDAVAVVSMESNFNPKAIRREARGHTSYGLFQLDDEWHPQHRGDIAAHIREGVKILRECEGTDLRTKVSHYNGGTYPGAYSEKWGRMVEARRDSLALYLWRHLR